MPDLSALNPAEREALGLLARGHTAKSVAAITGRSVGSINERLREARRKTGVGSSRELARLLAAQENRDEQIGMAAPGPERAAPPPEAAPSGSMSRKVIPIMALIFAGGAAALALFLQSAPGSAPADDPLIGAILAAHNDPAPKLYAELRAEHRDEAWAPSAETALRNAYSAVPGIAGGTALRVRCGAHLCEVAGTIPRGSEAETNAAMQALQDGSLLEAVRGAGLADRSAAGFGTGTDGVRFYAYWNRKRP